MRKLFVPTIVNPIDRVLDPFDVTVDGKVTPWRGDSVGRADARVTLSDTAAGRSIERAAVESRSVV